MNKANMERIQEWIKDKSISERADLRLEFEAVQYKKTYLKNHLQNQYALRDFSKNYNVSSSHLRTFLDCDKEDAQIILSNESYAKIMNHRFDGGVPVELESREPRKRKRDEGEYISLEECILSRYPKKTSPPPTTDLDELREKYEKREAIRLRVKKSRFTRSRNLKITKNLPCKSLGDNGGVTLKMAKIG